MKTTEQIQAELESLQAELSTLNSRYNEIEKFKKKLADEQKELLDRHKELVGRDMWGNNLGGLIGKVNRELLESKSPVLDTNPPYNKVRRIISVDKKWIELKTEGKSLDSSIKYNRETGWRMRSRDGYGAIDAQKALDIWNEFNGVVL